MFLDWTAIFYTMHGAQVLQSITCTCSVNFDGSRKDLGLCRLENKG